MQLSAKERIIVALDVPAAETALALVGQLQEEACYFKVGMELYYSAGPGIVRAIREAGGRVFLDLKFHDIPNTVAGASRAVTGYGVDMFNVHAAGGLEMMRQAAQAAAETAAQKGIPLPLLLGVTVLTSFDEVSFDRDVGARRKIGEQVVFWARQAQAAGLGGVVASPWELAAIRAACGDDFVTVIPGVRPAGADLNDQKRVMTPGEAVSAGATYLVIGRPITRAADPREAFRKIASEIEEAGKK